MKKIILNAISILIVLWGILFVAGICYIYYKSQTKQKTDIVVVTDVYTDALIEKARQPLKGTHLNPKTMDEIRQAYNNINMTQVPYVFIDSLPNDFTLKTIEDKTLFLKIITALMLRTNELIAHERAAILALNKKMQNGQRLTLNEQLFFDEMVIKYDAVLGKTDATRISQLMLRVDTVPVSIGVAQAILFTNWGQKNLKSIYGEFGWIDKKTYQPIKFDNLTRATDSYVLALNSRSQLEGFREQRRRLKPLAHKRYLGYDMTMHLNNYMENEKKYSTQLANVYHQGLIKQLDKACFLGTCEEK